MPGMNGTGPQGQGPKTGRGAGHCAVRSGGNSMPLVDDGGLQNAGNGMRGRRGSRGGGRNCGGGGNRGRFGNRTR